MCIVIVHSCAVNVRCDGGLTFLDSACWMHQVTGLSAIATPPAVKEVQRTCGVARLTGGANNWRQLQSQLSAAKRLVAPDMQAGF